LFPAKVVVKGQDLKPALGLTLATVGLVALDPHDTPYFHNTTSWNGFNNVFSGRNTELASAAVPLSFYVVGLARRDRYAQETSLFAGEAVADSEILATVLKYIGRRELPRDVQNGDYTHTWFKAHVSLFHGVSSFPSGHAIGAFSIATVFANRYRQHRWVPWVAYGLAGLVGFSRIPLQAHFPSDVFAGAVFGYTISHYVVLRQQ
jgi:membrane-associated phospholipid phosphatase